MENHINLFQPANHYLQHFYVALTNFEQLLQEDRLSGRRTRNRKSKQKKYGLTLGKRRVLSGIRSLQ